MKNKLRFIAFLGAIVAAVAWAEMPDVQSVTAGKQFSRTKISNLACPISQTEYYHPDGERDIPLPCRVVDAYEAKLVNAGYCYKRFSFASGAGGRAFSWQFSWQQCQMSSTLPDDNADWPSYAAANPRCSGVGDKCPPAPSYPLPSWGHENLPCIDGYNSITRRTIHYDSNDPRFTLSCAASATGETQVRQDEYGKPPSAAGTPTNLLPPSKTHQYSSADLTRDAAAAGMSEEDLSAIQRALAIAGGTPPEDTAAGLVAQQQFLLRQKNHPTVLVPASKQDREFAQGLSDRTAWEQWFNNLRGDYKTGAFYWSSQRSLPQPGSSKQLSIDFLSGCTAAKVKLTLTDDARKTSSAYKLGWNSYAEASLAVPNPKDDVKCMWEKTMLRGSPPEAIAEMRDRVNACQ
jgi:hypothetical protein